MNFHSLLKRGVRIALRAKVNDSLIVGLRIIDSILPVGRGQRQLILGDRYTGKTSIFLSLLIKINSLNIVGNVDSFGTKRIFGLYIGINVNLSKLTKIISELSLILWYTLILSSHSSSSSLLSFLLPYIGVSISERLRDRGIDSTISFDDFSKHSKAYRQISLILAKIPSRDAYPADIFNIHSSLLERCSKLKYSYFGGSITAFPIIETINSDITEYIATNVISITDGQFYTSKKLFLDSCRPSIDSSLSVSRIGSNAQCKLVKMCSIGIKNELTNYRNMELSQTSILYYKLVSLNLIFFQDHLFVSSIETTVVLLIYYRNGIHFNNYLEINTLLYQLGSELIYFYYIIFITKSSYSHQLYFLLAVFIMDLSTFYLLSHH